MSLYLLLCTDLIDIKSRPVLASYCKISAQPHESCGIEVNIKQSNIDIDCAACITTVQGWSARPRGI